MSGIRLAHPEGEGQEVGSEAEYGKGCGVQDGPVGRQSQRDVAKLNDLVNGEGKREEGRPQYRQGQAEGEHGKEKDVGEEDENMMERDDSFPSKAGEEGDSPEFLVLRKGLEVRHHEVGEGEEGQRDGDGEEAVCVSRLKDKGDGRKHVAEMDSDQEFAKAAIGEAERRNGIAKDNGKGQTKKEEGGSRELASGKQRIEDESEGRQ